MGPSAGATDAMDEEKGEGAMVESAVNRQTALLSLDVLARVLGRRHQDAFVGVLDDVTEIVAGEGPGALPGEKLSVLCLCSVGLFCLIMLPCGGHVYVLIMSSLAPLPPYRFRVRVSGVCVTSFRCERDRGRRNSSPPR